MSNYVTQAPASFFGIGQIWYWGSGLEAEIVGYHPTKCLLAMRILATTSGHQVEGEVFWDNPVILGQTASQEPYKNSVFVRRPEGPVRRLIRPEAGLAPPT